MLEESEGSAAAQQEIRGQRETELLALKQRLEEEAGSHESAVSAMRQKYSKQIEELNEQLDSARKVSLCCIVRVLVNGVCLLLMYAHYQTCYLSHQWY